MSFKTWITGYLNDDSPYGDLAGDLCEDKNLPDFKTKVEWRLYMERRGTVPEALRVLEEAWRQYEREPKGTK